ncbi:MAG TPA: adenosine deaminase [Cytophagales bacterium]|nr:adenosine deaminase [Cytophagales bacterium]HAA20472.1 adenosine deaminase [Cytophagales bacterium]HAP60009.1 adenosine deaminase [Cytophagales bacterium]
MPRSILFLLFITSPILAQTPSEEATANYLESIRDQEAYLRQFFQYMPKGGDLHHHFSGSVYAETFFEIAEQDSLWVNMETGMVSGAYPSRGGSTQPRYSVQDLIATGKWQKARVQLLMDWSNQYFDPSWGPSDEQFFNAFGKFGAAADADRAKGLLKLKERAKNENVQYIEEMLTGVRTPSLGFEKGKNEVFWRLQGDKQASELERVLEDTYWEYMRDTTYTNAINKYVSYIESLHKALVLDDQEFKMRFQTYGSRNSEPIKVFARLLASFQAAQQSDLIVGVNFVSPEHYLVSMRDYWLHMQMFNFLKSMYKDVPLTLHAGELTVGLVRPEDLSWHIDAAVNVAGAQRIGHGIDIAYERNSNALLAQMANEEVAVEINLTSNDFILGVSGSEHPLTMYHRAGVPLVICTDDAGILRTDLTQQFVILARDYPELSYADIKQFVYNSIRYSFMSQRGKKEGIEWLDARFKAFELEVAGWKY